jgi:hypothetical protein
MGTAWRISRSPTLARASSARAATLFSAGARSASSFLSRASSRIVRGTGPRLIDQFTTELAQAAETTKGIWVRQITLANPSR